MQSKLTEIVYDVELQLGETLGLPKDAAAIIGPGHWVVSIRPTNSGVSNEPVRNHAALLDSYSPEDEGLYDDYSSG